LNEQLQNQMAPDMKVKLRECKDTEEQLKQVETRLGKQLLTQVTAPACVIPFQLTVGWVTGRAPSSHGALFLSIAMSTTDRQVSRLVAFFHADERPIFCGFKSALIARSQVWLGLPFGRFQSERGWPVNRFCSRLSKVPKSNLGLSSCTENLVKSLTQFLILKSSTEILMKVLRRRN